MPAISGQDARSTDKLPFKSGFGIKAEKEKILLNKAEKTFSKGCFYCPFY